MTLRNEGGSLRPPGYSRQTQGRDNGPQGGKLSLGPLPPPLLSSEDLDFYYPGTHPLPFL